MSLEKTSVEILATIEELAAHGFTMKEVEEIIGKEIIPSVDGDLAFRKGFLKSELELRQRIFKDAKNGSSPAQMLAKKIMDEAAYKFER